MTHEQAVALFADDAMSCSENLYYMPQLCLYFYLPAYIEYLNSDESKGMSDGASCFYGVLEIRRDDIVNCPVELKAKIVKLLNRLAERQEWYDANPEIYDSFEEKTAKYLKMIT